jgi:hypothetical protein
LFLNLFFFQIEKRKDSSIFQVYANSTTFSACSFCYLGISQPSLQHIFFVLLIRDFLGQRIYFVVDFFLLIISKPQLFCIRRHFFYIFILFIFSRKGTQTRKKVLCTILSSKNNTFDIGAREKKIHFCIVHMSSIIGLCGSLGAGKDSFANVLIRKHNYKKLSCAGPLKDITARLFSWPRHLLEGDTEESRIWRETKDAFWENELQIPDFTPRLALQRIGTECLRNGLSDNIWISILKQSILTADSNVVITDCRFPNEINMIRALGGTIICIQRSPLPVWWNLAQEGLPVPGIHLSETAWVPFITTILPNIGTIQDLEKTADDYINNF